MALPVLDGNQSATTLSSVVTGGEHIVAHSVVSLGASAISNITTAVSGTVVTIPQINKIIASVATDGLADATLNFVKIGGHQDGQNQISHIVHVSSGGAMKVDASDSSVTFGAVLGTVTISNFPSTQTIAGTVTANGLGLNYEQNLSFSIPIREDQGDQPYIPIGPSDRNNPTLSLAIPISGTVTVDNSVTIGSLPAISGTVTANAGGDFANSIESVNDVGNVSKKIAVQLYDDNGSAVGVPNNPLPVSGTVTANVGNITDLVGSGYSNLTDLLANDTIAVRELPAISGTVTVGNSITIGSFATSVTARLINPAGTAVTYAEVGTAGSPSIDVLSVQGVSGGTAVPVSISSVTIGAVPNGALTTRFGSVTTANTAQISSAVTLATRKYLLIQNVTTSSNVITVGVGFTPTTTQGIQLAAGAGITFESSYIPTGAVYILSSVTASPFTILEA